uniref:ZP-N domain-containing protein n=1 Tax=Biomphalaria glabrata TaxID=6526 RepID=A0A2C9L239_BIOGL
MCNASKTTTPPTTTSTTRGTTTTTTTATTRGTTHASQHFTTDLPATATGQSGNVRHDFICHFTTVEIFIPVSEAPNAVLRLRDPSCVLVNNGTHHVITFPFNLCGTSVTSFKDYSIVTNYVTVHTVLLVEWD